MRLPLCVVSCAVLAIAFAPSRARGQWTVTNLHDLVPANAEGSFASDIHNGQVVGGVFVPNSSGFDNFSPRASLWTVAADSWVNLHPFPEPPSGIARSSANAVYNGTQVGRASAGLTQPVNASRWTGSAASWTDITSTDPPITDILDFDGSQMVANATVVINAVPQIHAAVWTASTGSWVDLHPQGATESRIRAVHNGQQVGMATSSPSFENFHAALWTGTPDSFVDLHPPGTISSFAGAVHNGQQVGGVSLTVGQVGQDHAALWTGTAESWVDLHPAGANRSIASGVYDDMQVGSVLIDIGQGLRSYASVWHGTPESWEPLPFPSGLWTGAGASAIWSDGQMIYVVGSGFRGTRTEALLWSRPVPEPSSALLLTASVLLAMVSGTAPRKAAGSRDENGTPISPRLVRLQAAVSAKVL
jgi:hypothetical protein